MSGAWTGHLDGAAPEERPDPVETDHHVARLLANLDEAQRLAVTTPAAPLCIRAGPGSGKTRVLTRRIAYRIATADCEARFSVAVTFTNRAATELSRRLSDLGVRDGVAVGTFHALAARQLRRHAADDGRRPPDVLADPTRLLDDLTRPGEAPRAIRAELDWCAARGLSAGDYLATATAAGRRMPLPGERLVQILTAYEHKKRRLGLVDFGDLLRLAARRLEDDAATAEAWRWGRRHFFVDELQDLNPAQLRLLRAWLGDRSDLCAVGDADQSIFGWSGAERAVIDDFASLFPGATHVDLGCNYRSSPTIVALSGVLRDSGKPAAPARVTVAGVGARGESTPLVVAYPDSAAEATGVAAAARRLRGAGERWADQAVLVRTRRQVADMITALEAAGVVVRAADPDAAEDLEAPDAVCVSTMHAAKGLQWPTVHVAGLEEGLMPIAGAEGTRALTEERRLLYVAVTRAQLRLRLSWAQQREVRGQPGERRPCRWLAGLTEMAASLAPADRRPPLSRPGGQRPPEFDEPAEPLTAALVNWREQMATAARIAPSAVLSDRDLAAIARSLPRTAAEVGAVTDLGAARVARLGPRLVELVAKHDPEA